MEKNPNHPKKGSVIKVEPIRKREDRERIEKFLANQPRNKGIFVTGCNTAYRAVDLTSITVGQVRGALAGFKLVVREKKTRKMREVVLNKKTYDTMDDYLSFNHTANDSNIDIKTRGGNHADEATTTYA